MDIGHILSIVGSAIFMIFFFGLCIFVHELGHFLVAKWRGFHVIAFSIGFRKIWGKKYKGVEYRIGWIPFGGYVDIPQIDSTGEAKDENGNPLPKGKPVDRILAAAAGPVFNIIFGFILAVAVWIGGLPQETPKLSTIEVAAIEQESPEYRAGLREGDKILKLNGKTFNATWREFVTEILTIIGDVTLDVERDGKVIQVTYRPVVNKAVSPVDEIAYPFFRPKLPLRLYPESGSAAAKAGVLAGDEVIAANGQKIAGFDDLEIFLSMNSDKPFTLTVKRDGKQVEIPNIIPEPLKVQGRDGVYRIGFTFTAKDGGMKIEKVSPGMPAEAAGLLPGDVIVKADGKPIANPSLFPSTLGEKAVQLTVKRGEKELELTLVPRFIRFTTIGVDFVYLTHPTPWSQFTHVIDMTVKSLRSLGVSLGNKLGLTKAHTTIKPSHLSGPIGIGRVLYISVYRGSIIQGLSLVVLVSFSLGLFNLLPIPVLDGGHILLAILELIFRRPVSAKVLEPIMMGFIGLLVAFMLYVSFYDVRRVIGSIAPEAIGIESKTPATAPAAPAKDGKNVQNDKKD